MENRFNTNAQASANVHRDVLFQVSLLQGLTNGDYDGSVTIGEVRQHGDTGLGTFDHLNGEMILLDGTVYRAAGDGSIQTVSDGETTPFCVATFLDADASAHLVALSDKALHDRLADMVAQRGKNRFYMIRIDGVFQAMHVRSVYAQQQPYVRLTQALEHDQTLFDYEHIEGTVVGLYCPPFMSYLNAAGWHMHFVSRDKTKGGHVLGLHVEDAMLTWDDVNSIDIRLPQNEHFHGFDLTVDQSKDIEKIEKNT